MNNWHSFFWLAARTTAFQLIAILGVFFLFGYMLAQLQNKTHEQYRRAFGWKGILFTAWFGTPFHELGHVFFAKLFRHQINTVSLFEPNEETGSLGHVEHSYNPLSLYQRIGNFFIGGAPMIFGTMILMLFVWFLIPNGQQIITPIVQIDDASITTILTGVTNTLRELWSLDHLTAWSFWVFLYLSFCVAAHMAPSRKDLKHMWGGLIWLFLIILVMNILFLFIGIDPTKTILKINYFLGFFIGLYLYTLCIAVAHYVLASIVLTPIALRKNNRQ